MKILKLPHTQADYLCPVNGLSDIYEGKTGSRIADQLIMSMRFGFMLISQKNAPTPKMILFSSGNIGRQQYEYWKDLLGYKIHSSDGKGFKTVLGEIKSLIDLDIPVILFGLDMFHLPYQEKFYKTTHIEGHIVLMIGYDNQNAYVHDNSKEGIQIIPFDDLSSAWEKSYLNLSKKNAYFGIEFINPNYNIETVINLALNKAANSFLNPPIGFMGIKGYNKLLNEFPNWHKTFDKTQLRNIYLHIVTFTGSVLPQLPISLSGYDSGVPNTFCGGRDKLSQMLNQYGKTFKNTHWQKSAEAFLESSKIIEQLSKEVTTDILNDNYNEFEKYLEMFSTLRNIETHATKLILHASVF